MSDRPLACRRARLLLAAALTCTLAALAGAQVASAQAPYWKLSARSAPTNLPLEGEELTGANDTGVKGEGMIVATATNFGDTSASGATAKITLSDQLPAGLEPTKVLGQSGRGVPGGKGKEVEMSCEPFAAGRVTCTFSGEIPPYEHLELQIAVKVRTKTPSSLANVVTVSGGGGGGEERLEKAVRVTGGGGATPFGVEEFEFTPENEDGTPDTQGGSHPYQLTTVFNLNQGLGVFPGFGRALPQAPALQRNLTFKIPAGVLGNPSAVPQCPDVDFGALGENGINACTDETAIGVASITFTEPNLYGLQTWSVPVFNLVPAPGEPAKFGIEVDHVPVVLDTAVRTGEDYGVTVSVHNTSQAIQLLGTQVTLWGSPGDPSHDQSRGWNCVSNGRYVELFRPRPECKPHEFSHPNAFVVLPTSCASPLATEVTGDAWSGAPLQARNEPPFAKIPPVTLSGCNRLEFNPSLALRPDSTSASTPAGGTVEVNMSQEGVLTPGKLAQAAIKETTLALPEGVQANAGAANGLASCGIGESGLLGEPLAGNFEQQFTPDVASCPDAAKIGTVVVETPLLPHPLNGAVYLGDQDTNPFAPPLVIYLIATEEEPVHREGSKVLIKLAGEIKITASGQLISTFKDTPQAPFEHLKIHLFDGPRASQSMPAHCGSYETTSTFVPWSEGVEAKKPSAITQITSGPGGGPCPAPGPLPFGPSFEGGAADTQAGAFTPFAITIGRPDGHQALTGLSMRLPQGAAAMLASVTPCPVAVADVGQCGPVSLIGDSVTASGLGASPVTLGGEAFLTESLRPGAPFGVSVKTSAEHVGPFDIGTIIANSTIQVDPNTAAATITAVETRILESNGHVTIPGTPLPTMVKGVPVQLKSVHVTVDRPNFEFNPTNCSGRSVTGSAIAIGDTLAGAEGGLASASTPYGVTGCGSLAFTPKLTASVKGQASKPNGTTFTVKVESARGQANIAKTFLQLPIALPSRLSTIQQACVAATFEANPASCDEGSNIGFAVAHTPVLKKPLAGPAYLVSHGNAAFPDVEFVLQSEGVTVVLDGKTDIKNGITYSRFETVPDAPVETFETVLPEGPHSALTSNVPESEHFNLCKQSLLMPTEITGQNGAVVKQQTKIALVGCSGVKAFKESALQKALNACRKKYKGKAKKKKRLACEARARKKYGPKKNKQKTSKKHH